MSKKYTDKELVDILTEVEVEFKKHLEADKEEPIAKSEKTEDKASDAIEYDEEDTAELNKMYGSMNKAEAEIHYKAVKKAIFGEKGEEMNKSEVVSEDTKMLKSENETLKSENDELKKSVDKFTQILTKMVKGNSAPKQKAITEMTVIKKSEEEAKKEEKDFSKLTNAEISTTLSSQVRSGTLKKSDKDAITKYYESKSIDLIKHLL